jgi:uncharacterized protein YunC (DUF1805 family)
MVMIETVPHMVVMAMMIISDQHGVSYCGTIHVTHWHHQVVTAVVRVEHMVVDNVADTVDSDVMTMVDEVGGIWLVNWRAIILVDAVIDHALDSRSNSSI